MASYYLMKMSNKKNSEIRAREFFCTSTYTDLDIGNPESAPALLMITHLEGGVVAKFKRPVVFIDKELHLNSNKQLPDYFCCIELNFVYCDEEHDEVIESAVFCWFQEEFPFNLSKKTISFFENMNWDEIEKVKF